MTWEETRNVPSWWRRFSIASLPIKLAYFLCLLLVLVTTIQAALWLAGFQYRLVPSRASGVLLTITMGTVVVTMLVDRRAAADYGLAVDKRWASQLAVGLLAGAVFYAGYYLVAWQVGAQTVRTGQFSWERFASGITSGSAGLVVAAIQQIVFAGFILSVLRQWHHRAIALIASAVMFGVMCHWDHAHLSLDQSLRLLVGMTLIAVVLNLVRLLFGNVSASVGLLAGCILVRRVLSKTDILYVADSGGLASWWAPHNDPRQAPAMWLVLLLVSAVGYLILLRREEGSWGGKQAVMDTSFKRVVPFSNLFAFAPLDLWLAQLIDAQFRVGWKYLPRLVWILCASTINTVLTLPERLLAPRWLTHRIPDPVFVVGVHRSGTTHLHNLLSWDRRFVVPRSYHIVNPFGILSTAWIMAPLAAPFLSLRRPMDNMKMSVLSPQEEEFAIAGMCRQSPYWALSFPRRVAKYVQYIFVDRLPSKQFETWRRNYCLLLRKLTVTTRKSPLLKSPYNTGRVGVLRQMFPGAKFIHITRHPYAVYRSNMHFAIEGFAVHQLQDASETDSYRTRFLDIYHSLEEAFYQDSAGLPTDDVVHVRLEDLESDPVGSVERIYQQLGLEFTAEFDERLRRYLDTIADYQKNHFTGLSDDVCQQIDAKMGTFMDRWEYNRMTGATDRAKVA